MYVFTELGSWMNTWIRLTEAEEGQRSKAEVQRYPGSVVLVPAPLLWDLLLIAFLTSQSHLSASPTHLLLCALSIPGWLSRLVVSLMPPCFQTHAPSTWNTPAAFPFFISLLPRQLLLPSGVTSGIAQFMRAFFITPAALCLRCLLSSVLFPFVQMSNMTINLFTYLQ